MRSTGAEPPDFACQAVELALSTAPALAGEPFRCRTGAARYYTAVPLGGALSSLPASEGEDAFGARDMVGETISDLTDRYLMQEKLGAEPRDARKRHGAAGEGTYGTVYKAIVRQTNQPVAIKRIRIGHEDAARPTAYRIL